MRWLYSYNNKVLNNEHFHIATYYYMRICTEHVWNYWYMSIVDVINVCNIRISMEYGRSWYKIFICIIFSNFIGDIRKHICPFNQRVYSTKVGRFIELWSRGGVGCAFRWRIKKNSVHNNVTGKGHRMHMQFEYSIFNT